MSSGKLGKFGASSVKTTGNPGSTCSPGACALPRIRTNVSAGGPSVFLDRQRFGELRQTAMIFSCRNSFWIRWYSASSSADKASEARF